MMGMRERIWYRFHMESTITPKLSLPISYFSFFENTKYFFNTHTYGEKGEDFKGTDSGVYPKGPNS